MLQHTTATHVGLDVSKASISVALLRPDGHLDEETIANTPEAVRRLVRRWPEPRAVRACYEAGPTGYDLYRQLTALGIDTTVIAPSLTPRRPGDRIKTNRRDARKLAGLFRAGELTAVRVPTPEEEAVRDLLRARQDEREDILRARHRLGKFLLRHGRVYTEGSAWTGRHTAWLTRQHFDEPAAERTLGHYRAELDMRLAALKLLDAELLELAHRPLFGERVARLLALRGIAELSALTIAVEVGDFTRFGSAPAFMAFVGSYPVSVRRASDAARVPSPRPAMPTSAGCSWRPPGTPAGDRTSDPRSRSGSRASRPRCWRSPPPPSGGSTTATGDWSNDASPRTSRSWPWPVNSPVSAGPSGERPGPSAGRT